MNGRIAVGLSSLISALPAIAADPAPALEQSDNIVLRGAGIFLVLVMIWFVLYKVLYPFLLRYYRDGFCKTVFWNLFSLYALTWIFVSLYVVLDFGFYWGWLPWLAAFLGAWWLISGVVLLLRRVPA
ncbi:MAG: hypothetical protein ACTHQM_16480 [Thermoanaerobaculia bacterium]